MRSERHVVINEWGVRIEKARTTIVYVLTVLQIQNLEPTRTNLSFPLQSKTAKQTTRGNMDNLILSKINCAIKTMDPCIKTVPRYKPWFVDQNKKKKMNRLHINGACPFFRNLCPIMVQMIHILFFAVLDSRSRTAQAGIAIFPIIFLHWS